MPKTRVKFDTPPKIISYASVGGYEEGRGPIGSLLDICDPTDSFGQKTWEMAEGEMARRVFNTSLTKRGLSHSDVDLIVSGDLQNQCVATTVGLDSFGIPHLGVYGACSTCTEALGISATFLSSGCGRRVAAVTTSHNSAAERQFRTPLEYGAIRSPSAQWTSTAGASFILSMSGDGSECGILDFTVGRIIDGATADASNMGAAMAFAAADTIIRYFEDNEDGLTPGDFDYIVTGDLGRVGCDILNRILTEKLPAAASRHTDCGLILYDEKKQDVHSGASGCGTSAAVLASHFLPKLSAADINRILFLSTGALMSPSSVLQGNTIRGIAPAIHICSPRLINNKNKENL